MEEEEGVFLERLGGTMSTSRVAGSSRSSFCSGGTENECRRGVEGALESDSPSPSLRLREVISPLVLPSEFLRKRLLSDPAKFFGKAAAS